MVNYILKGKSSMNAIINAKILANGKIIEDKAVIYNEKIIGIQEHIPETCKKINAEGLFLSAGFIDMHIHGFEGSDFSQEITNNTIQKISNKLLSSGVTSYLPTLVSMSETKYLNVLDFFREYLKNRNTGAEILGLHLEGPALSPHFKGAHNPNYIYIPQRDIFSKNSDIIKMITLAPEMIEDAETLEFFKDKGICLAAGHTSMTMAEAEQSYKNGVTHCTHIFNAMLPMNHREPGLAGEVIMGKKHTFDIVADNMHVHPCYYQFLYSNTEKEKMCLITDSVFAAGLPDGTYGFDERVFVVRNGNIYLENGTIAGSMLTLDKAVRNVAENTTISIAEIINMVTINPAKVIGAEKEIGSIEEGKKANMVLFDNKIQIKAAIVNGTISFIN